MTSVWMHSVLPYPTNGVLFHDETPPRRLLFSEETYNSQPWAYPPGTPLKASKKVPEKGKTCHPTSSKRATQHDKETKGLVAVTCLSQEMKKVPPQTNAVTRLKKVCSERYNSLRKYISVQDTKKNALSCKRNSRDRGASRKLPNRLQDTTISFHQDRGTLYSPKWKSTSSNNMSLNRSGKKKDPVNTVIPHPDLVVKAVESLYADRIRPFMADTLQRVKLLAKQSMTDSLADSGSVETGQLHALDMYSIYSCIKEFCSNQLRLIISDTNGTRSLFDPSQHANVKDASVLSVESARHLISTSILSRLEAELINIHVPTLPPVDPRSLNNPYPLVVWKSFYSFLIERLRSPLSESTLEPGGLLPYQFKGGRYGLAVKLKHTKEHPHLRCLSLGELCHLVQLAITGRLLAYERSVLQPVASCVELSSVLLRLSCPRSLNDLASSSEAYDPEQKEATLAESRCPEEWAVTEQNGNSSSESMPSRCFETGEEISYCLSELFKIKPEGYVIAQLKRVLFSRYGKEILPEKFGYRKLTECLRNDPMISSICDVVSMDSSVHRLLVVPKKCLAQNSTGSDPSSPATMTSPQSYAAGDHEHSLCCNTTARVSVHLPEGIMDPIDTYRSITYYAWKFYRYDNPWATIQ